MNKTNIFSDIIAHKIPADIVYQDDLVTAFRDIFPKAPIHILIVPNKCIPTCNDVNENNENYLGRIFTVAAKIAYREGIDQQGYRLIMNCNHYAGQEIYHMHVHLLGGCQLGPMIINLKQK